jgi:hypothetical protein
MPKPPSDLHLSTALAVYSFAVSRLHDPNWTGSDLYDELKQHVRGRREPRDLLRKTLPDGVLYLIGSYAFDDFLVNETHFASLRDEYVLWHLEAMLDFVRHHGAAAETAAAFELADEVQRVYDLYDFDEGHYFDALKSRKWRREVRHLREDLADELRPLLTRLAPHYARDVAERLFHDRALCSYIANLVVSIGFDGTEEDEPPHVWVDRTPIPTWARQALMARERGKCAACSANITLELHEEPHVDHIVPLARGGSNDLVNLQILCSTCNLAKSSAPRPTSSSVPPYLQRELRKRALRRGRSTAHGEASEAGQQANAADGASRRG